MGKFTKVSQETFKEIQLEAGLILNQFDPSGAAEVEDSHIVCATTGGIEIACKPEFVDYGEDIDNVPNGMLEFKEISDWACSIAFTALNASAEVIKMALGAADSADGKITPRFDLKSGDTKDIWWVGERADGGFVACCLKNALSTEGFTLKTTKKGKGQLSCTLTGHVSIEAQNVVPMEFYVQEGANE
jgi:hypothetical protein